jgi:nicotinamide-nucleotide amidase
MAATDTELRELARELGEALMQRGLTVATAESCSGGWIAKSLTDLPGSSAWFGWGFVTYANEAKIRLLGIEREQLEANGAVSEPIVRAMAEGAAAVSGSDLSVAVSGIAGPDGGSAEKPVGTVWFAWTVGKDTEACSVQLDGDRDAVRRATVEFALRGLIKRAQTLS